jgi:pSer/pThr/pTyr-binding forkhead associated (FHA) protein
MPAQLVPINGGSTPAVLISRPVILVGRHIECDVRIDSPQISRRHCCLAMAYDRLVIRDLGSSNGVRVNGRVVDEAQLKHGDEVAIAQFIYRLVSDMPAPNTALATRAPKPPVVRDEPIIDLSDDFIPLDDD